MGRSQQTFAKKEKEKKRLKKRKEKKEKMLARKEDKDGGEKKDMMAYIDADGNLSDTPPDPEAEKIEIEVEDIQIGVPKREKVVVETVKKGIVDFFNHDKGFGFIKETSTGDSHFVHVHGLEVDEINEGDKVTYELEKGLKGMNAVRVKFQ